MNIKKIFSENDLAEIKAAVQKAESEISGEIVPVVVEKCGNYSLSYYRASFLILAFTALLIFNIDRFYTPFLFVDPLTTFIVLAAGAVTGIILLFFYPQLKVLFIGNGEMERNVAIFTDAEFLSQEIFNTRQRTGILILIALFEKKVIIKADKGIAAVVDQKVWDDLIKSLISLIRKGEMKKGLIKAINDCAGILKERGFTISPDDTNELSDDLRIGR
ncbi:MAG: TPM domain-containing protein [bacterium]